MKSIYPVAKFICIVLAALIALSAIAFLTGCKNGETGSSEPTAAADTPAISVTENVPSDVENIDVPAADSDETAEDSQVEEYDETVADDTDDADQTVDEDEYIDKAEAIAGVKQLAGSGAQIISSEKGYTPDGLPAWIIVVAPVTKSDEPVTVTYYAGYQFCYADDAETYVPEDEQDSGQEADEYIDRSEAIANVKSLAGSGAQIISCEKGYSPEGFPAWIVAVSPVSKSDDAPTVIYYSGYQFCYPQENSDAESAE